MALRHQSVAHLHLLRRNSVRPQSAVDINAITFAVVAEQLLKSAIRQMEAWCRPTVVEHCLEREGLQKCMTLQT